MDFLKILNAMKGKNYNELLDIAVNSSALYCEFMEKFCEQSVDDSVSIFYYISLLVCNVDGSFDEKEISFINNIIEITGLDVEKLTAETAKQNLLSCYSIITPTISKIYKLAADLSINPDFSKLVLEFTNGLKLDEIIVYFICAVVCINGNVDDNEIEFIQSLIDGTLDLELDNGNQNVQDFNSNESKPPKVVKVGASLYNNDYNKYFSVGAEILLEGEDAINLDVRVQLLDSTGFILESFDETISYVERGIFHFGREYSINCNPSSFKVICGARNRGELKEQYKTSRSFRCSGMRFTRNNSSFYDECNLACMLENVGFYDGNPEAEISVVFYDQNDIIVGGARLDGEHLYLNQPDRYETNIDCINVVNKTHTFRWNIDIYSVR